MYVKPAFIQYVASYIRRYTYLVYFKAACLLSLPPTVKLSSENYTHAAVASYVHVAAVKFSDVHWK